MFDVEEQMLFLIAKLGMFQYSAHWQDSILAQEYVKISQMRVVCKPYWVMQTTDLFVKSLVLCPKNQRLLCPRNFYRSQRPSLFCAGLLKYIIIKWAHAVTRRAYVRVPYLSNGVTKSFSSVAMCCTWTDLLSSSPVVVSVGTIDFGQHTRDWESQAGQDYQVVVGQCFKSDPPWQKVRRVIVSRTVVPTAAVRPCLIFVTLFTKRLLLLRGAWNAMHNNGGVRPELCGLDFVVKKLREVLFNYRTQKCPH